MALGVAGGGWRWTRPESALLVVGPPRSGKTSGVVVPNVLAAAGPVLSTSTKPDVLAATAAHRQQLGRCRVFDPAGSATAGPGVEALHWSPVRAAADWDAALAVAAEMTSASRGRPGGDSAHWVERGRSLIACLLHAGAVGDLPMRRVVSWVDRRQGAEAAEITEAAGSPLAADRLAGLLATEDRELSGIWSTASGVLAAYASERALATTDDADFDAGEFVRSSDTVYVCAPRSRQEAVAPLVAGLVAEIRDARYRLHAEGDAATPPTLLALDEVANIAPLGDLPGMVSDGGSQGLLVVACLQDLSQARQRWGPAADGFLTLFGAKLILPGVSDPATLRGLSDLAGTEEARVVSRTRGAGLWRTTTTVTSRRQPALDPGQLRAGRTGHALFIDGASSPQWLRLVPPGREQREISL